MAYQRPTLAELDERARADIATRLPGADASLRRTILNVLARVLAGALHGLYGYLDYIWRQMLPDTAAADMLDRHAALWLRAGRIPASYASGECRITGDDGAVIPAGARLVRGDGVEYEVDAPALVAAGEVLLHLTAVEAGAGGNASVGAALTLTQPIAGVQSTAVVETLAGGADQETDDALRARVLARMRQPPHGGATADYITWAKEAGIGVTRAWVYPQELGTNTVTVRIMCDDALDPVPSEGAVAQVQAYITPLRPVTAVVHVVAPIPDPLNPQIRLTPDTPEVRDAVAAELIDMLRREATPGGSYDVAGVATTGGRVRVSHLREAISIAAGEVDHELVAPVATVESLVGHLPVLGEIVWLP